MGSVLGSKNILAIVAYAEKDDYPKGDERLKSINQDIGRGDQSKGYRHPMNRDGGGGTGRLERVLDINGVLPFKNFAPNGENLAEPVHIETIRDSNDYVIIDKQCFGCQISCHQDVYDASPDGKDPDPKKARKEAEAQSKPKPSAPPMAEAVPVSEAKGGSRLRRTFKQPHKKRFTRHINLKTRNKKSRKQKKKIRHKTRRIV